MLVLVIIPVDKEGGPLAGGLEAVEAFGDAAWMVFGGTAEGLGVGVVVADARMPGRAGSLRGGARGGRRPTNATRILSLRRRWIAETIAILKRCIALERKSGRV